MKQHKHHNHQLHPLELSISEDYLIMKTLLPLLLLMQMLGATWAFSSARYVNKWTSLTATSSSSDEAQPVEKVAIIGSGIAGLSLAHALRSTHIIRNANNSNGDKPIQIDIFDSRPSLDEKSGSGIQLTGGISALRRISPTLQREVCDASLPLQKVVSTCRPWFGDDEKSWKIFELDIQQAIREKDAADRQSRIEQQQQEEKETNIAGAKNTMDQYHHGLVTEDGEVLAYTILRGTLQRILQEQLLSEHDVRIQFDKRLCGISYTDNNENGEKEGIVCKFTDKSQTGPYDLVVGCDGIQSAVRQFVITGTIQQSNVKESAIYSGLRITFAIQEEAEDDDGNASNGCQFTQFFGNGAYALTSSYGAGQNKPFAKGAFLVYPDANYIGPFPKKTESSNDKEIEVVDDVDSTKPLDENADWTQDKRVPKDKIMECLNVLQSASIPGNEVSNIIERSDRFFDLGVYLHNPFSWNGWVREVKRGGSASSSGRNAKFAVTTGDASHAMPPFLGQGANQAIQDSCSLAAKILEYNSQIQKSDPYSKPDLKTSLKEYESRRWLPTTSITAKAAILGYLEVGPGLFGNFRDAFFFVMGKVGIAKKVFLDAASPKM